MAAVLGVGSRSAPSWVEKVVVAVEMVDEASVVEVS